MFPSLKLKTNLKFSLQLVQTARFLQASLGELEALLAEELDANPALVWERQPFDSSAAGWQVPGWRKGAFDGWLSAGSEKEAVDDWLANYPDRVPILDQLAVQIGLLASGSRCELAVALLGYLDDRGFLSEPPEHLSARLRVELDEIRAALAVLHELEPPGIGACDTRECLLIQCNQLQAEGADCGAARQILEQAWDDFLNSQWKRAARRAGVSLEEVEEAARFLRNNCYPYPLTLLEEAGSSPAGLSGPDLIVSVRPDGQLELHIPGEERFSLCIASGFQPGSDGSQGLSPPERRWVRQHVDRAHLILQSLKQRWETLRRVGEHLIAVQQSYLLNGPSALISLTRSEVARSLGLSESTVSRAVQGKILQLPDRRLVPLSDLFDASLPVKSCLRDILAKTPHPLCDREIVELLRVQGYVVARRTVAKYRAQLALTGSRKGAWRAPVLASLAGSNPIVRAGNRDYLPGGIE
jgi:RNA polymerase sigma-54 factor